MAVDEGLSTTERQCHDYRDQYIHEFGKPDEVIVLGPVGLVAETMKPGSYKICNMCHEPMKSDDDYGGDCVFCMADCGDPECLKTVIQIGRTARRAALL